MDRDEAFEFLDRTARGIAEMFGSSCETLVHDMGDPSHPIMGMCPGGRWAPPWIFWAVSGSWTRMPW